MDNIVTNIVTNLNIKFTISATERVLLDDIIEKDHRFDNDDMLMRFLLGEYMNKRSPSTRSHLSSLATRGKNKPNTSVKKFYNSELVEIGGYFISNMELTLLYNNFASANGLETYTTLTINKYFSDAIEGTSIVKGASENHRGWRNVMTKRNYEKLMAERKGEKTMAEKTIASENMNFPKDVFPNSPIRASDDDIFARKDLARPEDMK